MRNLFMVAVLAASMASVAFPSRAALITYFANLSGPNESPTNNSPGTGSAVVTIDSTLQTMEVQVTFTGLTSNTTASHIHCCTLTPGTGTAGVATITPTFTGFPLGVTSGTYDHTFDLTSASAYNPAFVTAQGGLSQAEAALLAGMAAGTSYLNIHTSNFLSGEIRGFLTASGVPEPASIGLFSLGLLGLYRRGTRATRVS